MSTEMSTEMSNRMNITVVIDSNGRSGTVELPSGALYHDRSSGVSMMRAALKRWAGAVFVDGTSRVWDSAAPFTSRGSYHNPVVAGWACTISPVCEARLLALSAVYAAEPEAVSMDDYHGEWRSRWRAWADECGFGGEAILERIESRITEVSQ